MLSAETIAELVILESRRNRSTATVRSNNPDREKEAGSNAAEKVVRLAHV
jgi:hypothetical protein